MPPKKRTTTKHRASRKSHSIAGKILPPLDVRSNQAMGDFIKRVTAGPLTIIMVYADWCGHCHEMMPHFDSASNNAGRSIQSVKMNETMVDQMNKSIQSSINKSASPIKVDGYPSILLMDKNGEKVSDIQAVKSTEAMETVMNQAGPLAKEAQLDKAPTGTDSPYNNMKHMSKEEKEARAASALETVSPPQEPLPGVVGGAKHQSKGLYHAMTAAPYRMAPSGTLFATIRRMMSCKQGSKRSSKRSTKRSTKRSSKQSSKRSTKQSSKQSSKRSSKKQSQRK